MLTTRSRLCASLLACTLGLVSAGAADAQEPGVFALSGFDPALPSGDLAPFGGIVQGKRWVGLGEPVHTSGGVYQMKQRLFQYLVEEKGFRVFGMENPWLWGEPIAEYVQTCQGSLDALMQAGLFGVWRSTEVRALLEWMCQWNSAHPLDRVYFYSFDIQAQAPQFGAALFAFLERLGIARSDPRFADLGLCDGVDEAFYPTRLYPQSRYDACQAALTALAAYFDANEAAIAEQTSATDLAWARVHLVGQQSAQETQKGGFPAGYLGRERGMAYFAKNIHDLRYPHLKTALWAHNGHLMRNPFQGLGGLNSMGHLLEPTIEGDYAILAITATQTYVNWPGVVGCGLYDYRTSTPEIVPVEPVVTALGYGPVLIALGDNRPHPAFLDSDYSIGDFYPFSIPGSYDALINLDVSPAMHPLPGVRSCVP